MGIISPYVDWLGDRYGTRRLLLLGAILFIAGMLLTGTMTNLWQFYLYFGVLLGIASTIFTVLLVSSVTLWFRTASLPAAHQSLCPRRLGFLRLRDPLWCRPKLRGAYLSYRQSPVLWQRASGQPLWVADIGNGLDMGMAPVFAGILWDIANT